MCGVGRERLPLAARVQRTSISNRLLRLFSLFSHILVTCDEDAATASLDSNPISGGERGTRHERTRDETRLNAALRSLVPRPAFAKKYRDCRADALLQGVQDRILNIGNSALAAEICAGPHHRLLRRQHCSSLCEQSEGHEHVANMTIALAHDFVGFLAVFGRHNIRPPHFASKVSYSASPQSFATCTRIVLGSCRCENRRVVVGDRDFLFLRVVAASVKSDESIF